MVRQLRQSLREILSLATTSDPQKRDAKWALVEREVRQRVVMAVRSRADIDPAYADDITQEILIQLQYSDLAERITSARSPDNYLAVVIRNKANDVARANLRELRSLDDFYQDISQPDSGSLALESDTGPGLDLVNILKDELRHLKKSDRDLLRLRFWRDLSIADIARELSQPYSRVAVRLFRILGRMRKRLQDAREAK